MRTLRLLAASIRDLGLAATLDQLPGLLLTPLAMRRLKRRKLAELSRDGFDAAHGTDTAGILAGRELGPCVTRAGHLVIPYETTSEAAIRMALDSLSVDFSRWVFVDLGCGKGKPLMVASSYPFRRLVGVDISPACIAVARRNIARYGPRRIDPARVELRVQDAADFAFPAEPLVVYLYNPFPGAVLERVVANLEASLRKSPRQAAVVYVNPHALSALRRCESFERAPTIADRMPLAAQGMPDHERAAVFVTRPAGGSPREAPGEPPA
jgi:SAM-dependent methyltransferase